MPVITKITPQLKNKDLFSIFVDGKFFCGLNGLAIGSFDLKTGQEISSTQLNKILESSSKSKAYERSLHYLSFRPRSIFEIRQYLIKKAYPEKIIDSTVDKLVKQGMLNDQSFCESWVNSRDLIKPTSSRRLFLELTSKGVDKEVIRQVLDARGGEAEIDNLKSIIKKKTARLTNDKLIEFLARRGYKYQDIKLALDDLSAQSD
ncbi:MAG: RecX family transcriptional regulator [bacterium]|nr:RecX family transcriptional regulator [bacterium]